MAYRAGIITELKKSRILLDVLAPIVAEYADFNYLDRERLILPTLISTWERWSAMHRLTIDHGWPECNFTGLHVCSSPSNIANSYCFSVRAFHQMLVDRTWRDPENPFWEELRTMWLSY